MPWRPVNRGGTAIHVKALSTDARTGAATEILRLAPGFWRAGPAAFTAGLEFYVLEGDFSLGDVVYRKGSYAYLPPGLGWSGWHCRAGAIILAMYDGPIDIATPSSTRSETAIVHKNAYDMPWLTGGQGAVSGVPLAPNLFTKLLRVDSRGARTFLATALPHHHPARSIRGKLSTLPVEEMFCLSGDYVIADVGRMGAGGYCWWRAGEWHGPVGSDSGYMMLVRLHDGSPRDRMVMSPASFSFTPPHTPVLPEDLRGYAIPATFPTAWD